MAFASIILGSFVGLVSATAGLAVFDLHIWQGLLLYSASGTLVAVLAILALLLRNGPQDSAPNKAQTNRSQTNRNQGTAKVTPATT